MDRAFVRLAVTQLEGRATPAGLTPAMTHRAYDLDFQFTAGGQTVPADGRGQTIAIVDPYHDSHLRSDLSVFDRTFGLPDPLLIEIGQNLSNPTALPSAPPRFDPGWNGEQALDVEWAHAVAPGAAILVVEANSTSVTDMDAAVDTARHVAIPGLPPVSVVTMSFGSPSEYPGEQAEDPFYLTPAGHTGITFVAATGDDYGYGGYAAYSPYVLAVGGTSLVTDASGNWVSESPWRAIVNGQVEGTAGGYSQYEPEPSWQEGEQQSGARGIPDVAYEADPSRGFAVYDSTSSPAWAVAGGTSAGTPQWAGLIAIANQGRALAGLPSLDGATQTLPGLYALPDSAFHVLARAGEAPGWNIDTGRGSPVGSRVVAGLLAGAVTVTEGGSVVPAGVASPAVAPAPGPRASAAAATGPAIAVGADAGSPPVVKLLAPDGTLQFAWTVFDPAFQGGVRVATADFNGDGVPDVVAGTGPGGLAYVRVLDGSDGHELFSTAPFADFTGGVFVAAGDVNGDGVPDLVVTPDEGGGPRVRVFSGKDFSPVADFFGINDPAFRGGARAAVGDVNGDGNGDLVVAAGFGGGPRVALFDGKKVAAQGNAPGLTASQVEGWKLTGDFAVFDPGLRNGVYVAAGDLDGDGKADLIFGAGPGGGPRVLALSGRTLLNGTQSPLADFFAGDVNNRGGVRVAARDLDGDGRADVITGAGTGGGSHVTTYAAKSLAASGTPPVLKDIDAFPGFTGGVFVG